MNINTEGYDNLIYFEGPDGSSKTTQSQLFCQTLFKINSNYNAIYIPNPPKTGIGKDIRDILLDKSKDISPREEALLLLASRYYLFRLIEKYTIIQ